MKNPVVRFVPLLEFPPQREKLVELRSNHPAIELYCAEAEAKGRGLIRAEYEACVEYSERRSAVPFLSESIRKKGNKYTTEGE